MEEFLKYIIPFLIDNKEAFHVDKKEEGEGTVIFTIHVAKEDMGKVIGKEGRTIQSIRNLIKILAVKENKRVMVEIAEPEGSETPVKEDVVEETPTH